MVSGSTGLTGSVDGVYFLNKKKRTRDDAKLTIVNRDTEEYCFDLTFERKDCRWCMVGDNLDLDDDEEAFTELIDEFLKEEWRGTASELCQELKKRDGSFCLDPRILGQSTLHKY